MPSQVSQSVLQSHTVCAGLLVPCALAVSQTALLVTSTWLNGDNLAPSGVSAPLQLRQVAFKC